MKKLISIITKNFLMIASSKISLIILMAGPILLMFFIGVGLADNGLNNVPASIFYEEETEFAELFSNSLEANSFVLSKTDSLESCKNRVRSSGDSLCIELSKVDYDIPKDIGINKEEAEKAGVGYSVNIHADFSQPRTVWGVISGVKNVVEQFSIGIRESSSGKVKEKFEVFSVIIDAEADSILKAINILEKAERRIIDQLSEMPGDIASTSIQDSISLTRQNIESAINHLPSEYHYLLSPIDQELSSIENNLNLMGYNSLDSPQELIVSQVGQLRYAINKLENTRDNLQYLDKENDKLIDLNWDYVLHPIPVSYEALASEELKSNNTELEFIDYLFPSLISFFILFISLFLAVNLISREKSSEATIRNTLSKASGLTFFVANFITIFLIVIIQIFILMTIASPFLKFSIFSNYSFLGIILFSSISFFILIGMLLGKIFETQETSIIVSISISIILIIFSSLITPQETLPKLIKTIVSVSPLVIMESMFRRIFIFDSTVVQNLQLIIAQTSATITAFIITIITFHISEKRR